MSFAHDLSAGCAPLKAVALRSRQILLDPVRGATTPCVVVKLRSRMPLDTNGPSPLRETLILAVRMVYDVSQEIPLLMPLLCVRM